LIWNNDSLMVTAISNGRSEDQFSAGERDFYICQNAKTGPLTQPVIQRPIRGALPTGKVAVA
jgi:hypothetical protein